MKSLHDLEQSLPMLGWRNACSAVNKRSAINTRSASVVFRLVLAVAFGASTMTAAVSTPELPNPGDTGVSKQQQEQIGSQAVGEIYKQVPVLPDSSPETQYVRQVAQKLVAVIPAQNSWPYEFHVIPQKEINAFALPGGSIFVNIGTITAADNEAELAGVLAHEMSHVYMQHSIKQMKKSQWTQGVAGVLDAVLGNVGGTVGTLGQLGVKIAGGAVTMKYSRTDEAEADAVGAIIMYKTGYDPHFLAQFFQKLDNMGSSGPQFLSDHPNPGNRQQAISQEVQNWPARDFVNESPTLATVKQHVQGLRAYSAQEIADGAKSGLWAQQNRDSGSIPANVAASSVEVKTAATKSEVSSSSGVPVKTRQLAYELDIPGASQWTDTGIEIVANDRVVITASGTIQNSAAQKSGPEGVARGWRDMLKTLPVNSAGNGALIGRMGDAAAAVPFLVGASKELTVNNPGHLFLGINQATSEQSGGSFHVSVKLVPAEQAAAGAQPSDTTSTSLSTTKISAGLKEALTVSTGNAVLTTGRPDGFLKNEAIKILLPDKLRSAGKGMRLIGMGAQLDELEVGMNRAAEQATPLAKQIFIDAVKKISFADARKILFGSDTAATEYFKKQSTDELVAAFSPIVHKSLLNVGVVEQYSKLMQNSMVAPLLDSDNFSLDKYVVGKTLDGLFFTLGEEEKKIRKNPIARTTALLKEVFGKKQ